MNLSSLENDDLDRVVPDPDRPVKQIRGVETAGERSREEALLSEQQRLLEVVAKGRPFEECLDAFATAATRLSPHIRAATFVSNDGEAGTPPAGAQYATPVLDGDAGVLGSLVLLFREPDMSGEWERKIGQFGAHFASIALERERTMRALRESREQLQLELSDSKLLQSMSAAMIHEENVNALYEKLVEAAVEIMGSDAASMQIFYPERGKAGELRLLASYGFTPEAQEYWKWVSVDAGSTCAQTLRTRKRTVAENIAACDFTVRRNDRAAFLEAGVHAAQSTPLFSRKGELLGMITTHWKRPHRPTEHDLRLFDILARQAADLIERRLAEKALRESEERFRAFVATSSDAVYHMSPDWSEMRYLSGRDFVADTSVPSRGWINKFIHPDDKARVLARINEAIATKTTLDFEHRVIRADGTVGWTHSRAMPLFDETGEITEWFGAATDVTLKKQAEAQQKHALRETQRMVETLQTAFLPQTLPQLKRFRFDAGYLPAGEGALVGGDWYDAAQMPDGRILLCVGDVTGHGLPAAVTAGKLRQAATVAALTVSDPAEILNILNSVLRFQHPDIFATAVLAFIDPDYTELCYASAGHPPALLMSNGNATAVKLEHGGLPLGVAENPGLTSQRIPLPQTFVAAFYSDGLTEFARDIDAAEEAIERAMRSLAKKPSTPRPAKTVLGRVLGEARPSDDVVLLLVQRTAEDIAYAESADDVPARKTWTFHSSDESTARDVRTALSAFALGLKVDADTAFAAQIILGEALANTVQHAPGMVEVTIDRQDDNLMLAVLDHGPGMKLGRSDLPSEVLDENGRGLFLMQALAAQVMVKARREGGTELRALLPLSPLV